ncbi:hypothetical protein K1T71_002216 [Dendrolimus kikuchii]|uniref:Uncharacterized protein n=2 Tax=Dendrolimus kikuchii TaxID=765133 RepID=A0ACC1DGV3_9NEOP|nr:hypothetical protein K1T71_002208 [Dendrolimus kikuchii]KAJ0182847.1 hypothetical protein K1T71_002216 [Dendrolimus kikuchii]
MEKAVIVLLITASCSVLGMPLETGLQTNVNEEHKIAKRFISPMFNLDMVPDTDFPQIRTKRSEEEDECEKLRLCRLHARSSYNFLAAYELYFVNKENARLWDHNTRSMADCEARYGDC